MNAATVQEVNPILCSKRESCRVLGGLSLRKLEYLIAEKKLPVVAIGRRKFIKYSALVRFAK